MIKTAPAAAVVVAGLFGTAHAHEQKIKRMQTISLHASAKHAVAYYSAENTAASSS